MVQGLCRNPGPQFVSLFAYLMGLVRTIVLQILWFHEKEIEIKGCSEENKCYQILQCRGKES
jgi:hypothetical protein